MKKQDSAKGARYGMVIDLDKCTGCGTCIVACAAENNVCVLYDESDKTRNINWLKIYMLTNGKTFPHTEVVYLPRPCMQCGNPPCVPVCPATATTNDSNDGIVSQIYTRCIGCRYCMLHALIMHGISTGLIPPSLKVWIGTSLPRFLQG